MKAIRKSDGKEIDVRLYHSEEYIETKADPSSFGVRVYAADALILEEPLDWASFRREVAKDIMCAVLSTPGMWENTQYEGLAAACIKQADELIKQLKDETH